MAEYVNSERKARKPHECFTCHRIIRPGETYMRGVGFDGGAWSWNLCAHCRAVWYLYDPTDYDDTYDDESYQAWARGDGDYVQYPPTITEWRHRAGYSRGWLHMYGPDAGQIMPIPGSEAQR